jgi:hypothetical protein
MKKILTSILVLGIISCNPLKKVNTDGFTHHNEFIIYKQDTVAKLTNIEYSLDNGKLVKEATFKLLDMRYGDKGKSIIAFVHNTHRDWEVELDYPISFSPFIKK